MNFKRVFIIFFLLLTIGISFGFVFLKFSAQGDEGNYFNVHWRKSFSRSVFWRDILGLHFDGDARSDFLGREYSKIMIKVVPMEGLYLSADFLNGLKNKIENITGKPTGYIFLDPIPASPSSTLEELEAAISKYQKNRNLNRNADLFLVLAYQNGERAESIGSTLRENGIVLFEESLNQNYKLNGNLEVFDQYALSTLLHEFGHQLGLDHNPDENCLMNEKVEISNLDRAEDVLVDFCENEIKEIKSIPY